jgi:FkbM family methyltransferase
MVDKQSVFGETHSLRRAISRLADKKISARDRDIQQLGLINGVPPKAAMPVDVVISPNEVTQLHGTGVLISRMFGTSRDVFSIRSRNHYGEHWLGLVDICLTHAGLSRSEAYFNVAHSLSGYAPRRAICVPYYSDDALSALAVAQTYGVPLCTYVMDDNNVAGHGIPDDLMAELLRNSTLRLAISPELRDTYELKYGLKFWLLPPVVPLELLSLAPNRPDRKLLEEKRGILVGTVWSRRWLQALRTTVRDSGLAVDWFGNLPGGLSISAQDLSEDGIDFRGFIAETELAARCGSYPYALIPSGTLDSNEDHPCVARFSLPSRMPFVLASANTPMIVLGSRSTAAARFVERLNVGIVTSYDSSSFTKAVESVLCADKQSEFRRNAVAQAERFSARNVDDWIWRSLEMGQACDSKFESLMPRSESNLIPFIEPPAPKDIWRDFVPMYQVMRRLRSSGLDPDFVVDVGASTGVWSKVVQRIFGNARFILIDPLIAQYPRADLRGEARGESHFELVEAAASNKEGRAVFNVSPDLYGSSLLHLADFRTYQQIEVPVVTLDRVRNDKKITGRGILKIDVQCAEHLVLEGAATLLAQIDVLVLEISLVRYAPEAKVFSEMVILLQLLGFRYYDDAGTWRSPVDGTLLQKDAVFIRSGLFTPALSS